jgi:hypothetical protein
MTLACMTAAHAAKPEMTRAQKKELAASTAQKMRTRAPQPRTMAQSNATKRKSIATGASGQLVPTELWSTLNAQVDAQGNVRVVETEGTHAPTTTATEGLPNE